VERFGVADEFGADGGEVGVVDLGDADGVEDDGGSVGRLDAVAAAGLLVEFGQPLRCRLPPRRAGGATALIRRRTAAQGVDVTSKG
jgi:hypothetical protein